MTSIVVMVQKKKKNAVSCSNLYIHDSSPILPQSKQLLQDISPPCFILSPVSCQAVKSLPSLFGILSSGKERRAGFVFFQVWRGFHLVLQAFVVRVFLPGPKRARQEPSTRADDTTHPGTSKKLGCVRSSIEVVRRQRR